MKLESIFKAALPGVPNITPAFCSNVSAVIKHIARNCDLSEEQVQSALEDGQFVDTDRCRYRAATLTGQVCSSLGWTSWQTMVTEEERVQCLRSS